MNIDNNTAKLLMSQVLKDQLDVSEDDATVGQAHPELLIDGPFKVSIKGINNINYKTDQCTICFELVRLKR